MAGNEGIATMSAALDLKEIEPVAANEHYTFCVARLEGKWVGFATVSKRTLAMRRAFAEQGLPPTEKIGLFFFAEISDGDALGIEDRAKAILLTGAIAQDPESAYGGVDEWMVANELRGNPDDYRCANCGHVACDRDGCAVDYDCYDELP
jgi:hypothetical protein